MLCKFKLCIVWFEFGVKLKPRWVNGLVGLALTYFELGYHSRAVPYIQAAHKNINTIRNSEECHFKEDDIKLLEAVICRANGDFKTASLQYTHLMPMANRK